MSTKRKTAGERVAIKKYDITTAYKRVFGSADGKQVLHDLMDAHGMLRSSFNPKEPAETAFREGERNVVLRILTILETKTDALRKHIEEIANARAADNDE